MNSRILSILFILYTPLFGISQNSQITGKVISAGSGQSLGGASVTLLVNSNSVAADQNGNFTFSNIEAGTHSIRCSYVGFKEKIIEEIVVKKGESVAVTISLEEKKDENEVVVTSRVRAARETTASLITAQKNAANVSDGVSFEQIRKTPDRTTSDVLKRVSGASIQDDRFAIIRGLNDRYNAAFINGAPLPSTESDRKAFAFDIFPSSILDNLVIYKTALPDMTGDFAGGVISITTKSIPAKNFTSISIGAGYNSIATGKDRVVSDTKGSKDWLGIDDGTRAIPAGFPTQQEIIALPFSQRAELAKQFGDRKWGVHNKITTPNYNFQLAQGLNIKRKGSDFFGALLAVSYNKNYTFNQVERNTYDFDITTPENPPFPKGYFLDSVYNDETIWAVLANFSLKINNRNSLSFKNNYSVNTDNRVFRRFGNPDIGNSPDFFLAEHARWFTSNRIYSSQLVGEHTMGNKNTKVDWLMNYSTVEREIPNLSRTSYLGFDNDLRADHSDRIVSQNRGSGSMFFTDNNENIYGIKADISQPFTFFKNTRNILKLGGGYQQRERDFTSRLLGFVPYRGPGVSFDNNVTTLPVDKIYLPENLGLKSPGVGGFMISDGTSPNANYDATSTLGFGYIMADQRFSNNKFRVIYGIRVENFNQQLNSIKDNKPLNLNTIKTDLLPSANFVYSLNTKMNFRLSYAKTLNRPEFRELAPFLFYDYATQFTIEGLDSLERAIIHNFDFRYEFYPGRAQVFSVSAFYKDFTNPIELLANPIFTDGLVSYTNAKSANVYGFEIEFRTLLSTLFGVNNNKSLWDKLTVSANGALMFSEVTLGRLGSFEPSALVTNRALQGQSPYLVNGSLGFNDEKTGISSTLSVNRVGDRVSVAGTLNSANIYEKGRTVLDFQFTKTLFSNKMEIKLNIKDMLAQDLQFYFDYDQSEDFSSIDKTFSSAVMPRLISMNLTHKF